jgi:hypothetical protein
MLWWILGIVAVWVIVAAVVVYWIGRTISHTTLEESAAELRRAQKHETKPLVDD